MHSDDQGISIAPGRPGDLETVAATVDDAERSDPAGAHPALVRRGPEPHGNCSTVAHQPGDCAPVAPPLPRRWARRIGGPAALGGPTVLNRRTVERILFLSTERVPVEATHWSTRLMARYAGVTQCQVRKVWQAADVKPIGSRPSNSVGTRTSPRRSSTSSAST